MVMLTKAERVGIVVLPRVGRVVLLRRLPKRSPCVPLVGLIGIIVKRVLVEMWNIVGDEVGREIRGKGGKNGRGEGRREDGSKVERMGLVKVARTRLRKETWCRQRRCGGRRKEGSSSLFSAIQP